jgi:ectoine hydroxylase-related dioxygenase (phytanoyl-CoA dioxygenase family)
MHSASSPQSSNGQLPEFDLAEFKVQGYVHLRDVIPRDLIERWRISFQPLLDGAIAADGFNRGNNRRQIYLPFTTPFDDPLLYANPLILSATRRILGDNLAFTLLAADTPLPGSEFQDVHKDVNYLFPNANGTPTYTVVVNVPLVDVTEENGPMEIWPITHLLPGDLRLTKDELERLAMRMPSIRWLPRAGDVLIRDLRMWHRGTPNNSNAPRPMLAIGYSVNWFRRDGTKLIAIPREKYDTLPPEHQQLLRFNDIS